MTNLRARVQEHLLHILFSQVQWLCLRVTTSPPSPATPPRNSSLQRPPPMAPRHPSSTHKYTPVGTYPSIHRRNPAAALSNVTCDTGSRDPENWRHSCCYYSSSSSAAATSMWVTLLEESTTGERAPLWLYCGYCVQCVAPEELRRGLANITNCERVWIAWRVDDAASHRPRLTLSQFLHNRRDPFLHRLTTTHHFQAIRCVLWLDGTLVFPFCCWKWISSGNDHWI